MMLRTIVDMYCIVYNKIKKLNKFLLTNLLNPDDQGLISFGGKINRDATVEQIGLLPNCP